MNVKELIEQGNRKIDYTLDNQLWYDYFNTCLLELAPILRIEATVTIPYEKNNNIYDAPDDLVDDNIIMIKFNNGNNSRILERLTIDDFTHMGFKLFAGKIELCLGDIEVSAGASFTVWYYRLPKRITTLSQEPEIPEPYQPLLLFYGAAKYNQTDEEPENETSFWKDYLMLRAQLEKAMKRKATHKRNLQWTLRRGLYG